VSTLELDKVAQIQYYKKVSTQDYLPLGQECLSHLESLVNPERNNIYSVYLLSRGLKMVLNILLMSKYF